MYGCNPVSDPSSEEKLYLHIRVIYMYTHTHTYITPVYTDTDIDKDKSIHTYRDIEKFHARFLCLIFMYLGRSEILVTGISKF